MILKNSSLFVAVVVVFGSISVLKQVQAYFQAYFQACSHWLLQSLLAEL